MLTKLYLWLHRRKQTRALNDMRVENAILRFAIKEMEIHRDETEEAYRETLNRINPPKNPKWKCGGMEFRVKE